MVIAAVRAPPPTLALTLKATLPGPLPVAPELTAIQVALDAAVHVHPVRVVTDTDPVPPALVKFIVGRLIE
jgi:hypothetical protein